jgi:5-methylcytosine-specific restriction endonuclease McrA
MYAWKGWEGKKYKTFCSDECSSKWWITHDWSVLRLWFLYDHKDNLVCNKCKKKIEGVNLTESYSTWGCLQVDHIVPIWIGGEEFDKSNLQILCMECANKKNKKDQKDFRNYKMSLVAICYLHCLFEDNNPNSLEEYF